MLIKRPLYNKQIHKTRQTSEELTG